MKAYNVYVGGMKIGTVFDYNVFEALASAINLFGHTIEVWEVR